MTNHRILRLKELKQITGLSRSTIYNLISTGDLKRIKISSRAIGFLESDVQEFLQSKIS